MKKTVYLLGILFNFCLIEVRGNSQDIEYSSHKFLIKNNSSIATNKEKNKKNLTEVDVEKLYNAGCRSFDMLINNFNMRKTPSYSTKGSLAKAKKHFEEVQRFSPQYYELCYKQLALCYVFDAMRYDFKGYAGALRPMKAKFSANWEEHIILLFPYFDRALSIDKDCSLAYFYRASCYYALSCSNKKHMSYKRFCNDLAKKDFEKFMTLINTDQWEPFSWEWEAFYQYALCLWQEERFRQPDSLLKNNPKFRGPFPEKAIEYVKTAAENGVVEAQELLRFEGIIW